MGAHYQNVVATSICRIVSYEGLSLCSPAPAKDQSGAVCISGHKLVTQL
ncbi:hypothetical protein BFJ69_g10701 [Fusarium oxysporum]|uniref:Uncharacterized protein n=1 Tax=Fusarium oxysporum TaxID=5507 RepID=A0A420MUQ8_FUSOX|nr:hypothetical protein BFJ69_g10701 [Fusarium oxysporum]